MQSAILLRRKCFVHIPQLEKFWKCNFYLSNCITYLNLVNVCDKSISSVNNCEEEIDGKFLKSNSVTTAALPCRIYFLLQIMFHACFVAFVAMQRIKFTNCEITLILNKCELCPDVNVILRQERSWNSNDEKVLAVSAVMRQTVKNKQYCVLNHFGSCKAKKGITRIYNNILKIDIFLITLITNKCHF